MTHAVCLAIALLSSPDDAASARARVAMAGHDLPALLSFMDADEYPLREAASSRAVELAASDDRFAARLLALPRPESLEVRARLHAVKGRVQSSRVEAFSAALDAKVRVYPQVDMLWYDDVKGCFLPADDKAFTAPGSLADGEAVSRAQRALTEEPIQPDRLPDGAAYGKYRRACRRWLVEEFRAGNVTLERALDVTRVLIRRENGWLKRNAAHESPPPDLPPG